MIQRKDRKGFTLVELMVVIVILGIIGTMAFVFVLDKPDKAKWEKARSDMSQIQQALSHYSLEHDQSYPDTLEELRDPHFPNGVPKDPWTKDDFIYGVTEEGFDLQCLGKDQSEGGAEVPEKDIFFNQAGEVKEE
ncbi:MAG: type II secretion system protein GspG [Planctomycetes bacterium]|nr:type II secretion system protein GspG [Planctomycetota bacterium]